jgi:hypothetical protein
VLIPLNTGKIGRKFEYMRVDESWVIFGKRRNEKMAK